MQSDGEPTSTSHLTQSHSAQLYLFTQTHIHYSIHWADSIHLIRIHAPAKYCSGGERCSIFFPSLLHSNANCCFFFFLCSFHFAISHSFSSYKLDFLQFSCHFSGFCVATMTNFFFLFRSTSQTIQPKCRVILVYSLFLAFALRASRSHFCFPRI